MGQSVRVSEMAPRSGLDILRRPMYSGSMSTSSYRTESTDQLIVWLGNVRFNLRGHVSRDLRRSLKSQESGIVAVLRQRGDLSDQTIEAIR